MKIVRFFQRILTINIVIITCLLIFWMATVVKADSPPANGGGGGDAGGPQPLYINPAADTPPAQSVFMGSINVLASKFQVSNGAREPRRIETLTIQRTGLGRDADILRIKIKYPIDAEGTPRQAYGYPWNSEVTFYSCSFFVPALANVYLEVYVDINTEAGGAQEGDQIRLGWSRDRTNNDEFFAIGLESNAVIRDRNDPEELLFFNMSATEELVTGNTITLVSGTRTLHVPQEYPTIQMAVNAANNGDIVLVAPGNYQESVFCEHKAVVVKSADGPTLTTLKPDNDTRVFKVIYGPKTPFVIEGFTIISEYVPPEVYYSEAAIFAELGPWLEVRNCVIISATNGISANYNHRTVVENCTLVGYDIDNDGRRGKIGIGIYNCNGSPNEPILKNNIIVNFEVGVKVESHNLPKITYTDFCCNCQDIKGVNESGPGIINKRPLFALGIDNYHLSRLSACIDAGDPESSYSLEPEPNGDRINLGAYGNTPEATTTYHRWWSKDEAGGVLPKLQNYPNPFNPETWIPYQLTEESRVIIKIYDSVGQLIRSLDLGHREAGLYMSQHRAAYWDGKNESGELVASGVYFYTIQAGDLVATRKMIVAK